MRPDPFIAFHNALRFGPGHCPPDLFAGGVPQIVRGLKVHANNISHARHVALEETYPRLLERMGAEEFHSFAETFLTEPAAAGRSLNLLGQGFADHLGDPAHRDIARVEWAWLECYCATEDDAFSLGELASLAPAALLDIVLTLHPATHLVELEEPAIFGWSEDGGEQAPFLLLSRPDAEVLLRRVGEGEARLARMLASPRKAGDLLDQDPSSLFTLIEVGAITKRGAS